MLSASYPIDPALMGLNAPESPSGEPSVPIIQRDRQPETLSVFDVEEGLVTFTPAGEQLTARKIIKAVKPDRQCEQIRERAASVCPPTPPRLH